MNIKISDIYDVLRTELVEHDDANYTVSEFCTGIDMSRATFYRSYKSLSEVYQMVISYQVERNLNGYPNRRIEVSYRMLLEHMREEANLYHSFYRQTKRLFFFDVLEPLIFKNLRLHYSDTALSDVAIGMICTPITHIIVRYIDHDFEEDIDDVYQAIYRVLAVAENVKSIL